MGLGDARDFVMDWIATNYYAEMESLLTSEGYQCRSTVDPPWYETDCPRSRAMAVHNEAITRLVERGKGLPMGYFGKTLLLKTLELKRFSEKDIDRQERAEGKP